jgi:predicted  nucleic acid-binding Zn-ribbon protein
MGRASSLYRLQTVDLDLDQQRSRLEEIEAGLADSELVLRCRELFDKAESDLQAAQAAMRQAEQELAAHKAKLEESEEQLYGGTVRNPKELQDLQADVESLHRHRATLEERLLDAMVEQEQAEALSQDARDDLSQASSLQASRNAALQEEQARVLATIERLQSEREAALANVTEGDLALYTQLRDTRAGLALAQVNDNTCGACGMTLAHSLRQEVHMGDTLVRCGHCGRILYAG